MGSWSPPAPYIAITPDKYPPCCTIRAISPSQSNNSCVLHHSSFFKFKRQPSMRPSQNESPQGGGGAFVSTDKAYRTNIVPTAPLLLTPFPPTKYSPELHPTYTFPTEAPAPTTSHSKNSISIINIPTKLPTLSPSLDPPPAPIRLQHELHP